MVGALLIGALAFALVPPPGLGPHWLILVLAVLALAWVVARPLGERRDDVLPAMAVVLTSIGLVVIVRVDPVLAARQLIWLAIALVLAVAIGPALRRYRVPACY